MTPDEQSLLVEADSHLSWALHRYSENWPRDFRRDVEELIAKLRKYS